MTTRTISYALIGVAAAGVLYWWWKKRQPQGIVTVGPLTVASWNVAPAQPGTPNTPTVDPVWTRRNPGVAPV